jgi:hypothetical protein
MSKLIVKILDDGQLKTNARGVEGTEAEILAELEELAACAGGELEVEKHEPGLHHHHHGHSHSHVHGHGGGHKH